MTLFAPTNGAILGVHSLLPVQLFDDENDPANDDLANARAIFGVSGTVTGDNTNADAEAMEPPLSVAGMGFTLWYEWTAPISGIATPKPTTGAVR